MTSDSFIGWDIASVSAVCPPPRKNFWRIKYRCWHSTNRHDQSPLVLLNRFPITVFNVIPMLNDRRMYRIRGQPYTLLRSIQCYMYKSTMVQEWPSIDRYVSSNNGPRQYACMLRTVLCSYTQQSDACAKVNTLKAIASGWACPLFRRATIGFRVCINLNPQTSTIRDLIEDDDRGLPMTAKHGVYGSSRVRLEQRF